MSLKSITIVPDKKELKVGDINEEEKTIVSRISTAAIDRDGDIVRPDGINKQAYEKNPVVLFGHGGGFFGNPDLPIGKNLEIKMVNGELIAVTQYYTDDPNSMGAKVFNYRKAGFPLAQSIGFRPTSTVRRPSDGLKSSEWDSEVADLKKKGWLQEGEEGKLRRVIKNWELLEYSDVVVPANPEAVNLAYEQGLITKEEKAMIEHKTTSDYDIDEEEIPPEGDEPEEGDSEPSADDIKPRDEEPPAPEGDSEETIEEPKSLKAKLIEAGGKQFLLVGDLVYPVDGSEDGVKALAHADYKAMIDDFADAVKNVNEELVSLREELDDLTERQEKRLAAAQEELNENVKRFLTDLAVQQTKSLTGSVIKLIKDSREDLKSQVFATIRAAGLFKQGTITWIPKTTDGGLTDG